MTTIIALVPSLETAWQDVDSSFKRFCLTAGIGAIEQMLCEDAQQLVGKPVTTAMKLRCRPGRRHRPRTGLAAGP